MNQLRIVSYAINGRGMGHLVRQLAILRWVRRITGVLGVPAECWVLTSSEADTLARREGVCAFKMPSKAMIRDAGMEPSRYLAVSRAWTLNIISGLSPSLLLVDTFPGGSFGELIAALEMVPHRVLVARRVRDEVASDPAYSALLPLYERIIEPDDRGTGPILIREREELLSRPSARGQLGVVGDRKVVYVTFGGGGDVAAPQVLPQLVARLGERDWHVVVGAGPLYDGPEVRGPGITWMSRYVPMELFAGFDAAVSAGGYNAFHELMYCGVPTVFTPQPRISDDQEQRTHRAQTAGAGRVAGRMEEVPDLVDELLRDPDASAAARALVPVNGAREAALQALAAVVPAEDLTMASRVLTPRLWSWSQRRLLATSQVLDVVRILSGGTPTELARRRAVLAELADRGVDVADVEADMQTDDRIERFFAAAHRAGAPGEHAVSLLKALRRKFPAANGRALADAAESLFEVWGRFDDWMGAVSLLRAIPVQRSYDLGSFVSATSRWLAAEEDLFDAQRAFVHLENAGSRPVAEVLRLLTRQGSAGALEGRA